MRYGLEVTVNREEAPALLERALSRGLTEDTEYHAKHCECVPHERDHNHWHATLDRGGRDAEFVSRVLDSERLEDEWQVVQMEQALREGNPIADVCVHVHVECPAEAFPRVVSLVAQGQDDLNALLEKWNGYSYGEVGEEAALRVVTNEVTDETYWLKHPSRPLRAHADWPINAWLKYTELGTVEFRWWFSLGREPHLVQMAAISLGIVEQGLWREHADA